VAEKIQQVLLSALSRAAADPGALPILASRGGQGLFPSTAAGKQAAQQGRDQGYLDETGAISERGLTLLLDELSPRTVLEDFVRAMEAREAQLHDLATRVCTMLAGLEASRGHLVRVLRGLEVPATAPLAESGLLDAVRRWTGPNDMPLPELYRQAGQGASLGTYHDALRGLARAGRVMLHPWTGPLYQMPQPEFALLIGHEIGYYVSLAGKE
jgi:hypothetical protein